MNPAPTMQQALSDVGRKERAHLTPGLTPKQDELLRYLIHREESGQGTSSYEEMAAALGVVSKSNIHRLVDGLEERGHIRRIPHRARQITVTQPYDGPSLSTMSSAAMVRELRRRGWSVSQ